MTSAKGTVCQRPYRTTELRKGLQIRGKCGPIYHSCLRVLDAILPLKMVCEPANLLVDLAPKEVLKEAAQIRLDSNASVAQSRLLAITCDSDSCPSVSRISPSSFLAATLSSLVGHGSDEIARLPDIQAELLSKMRAATIAEIRFQWHDIRNACMQLITTWRLLKEEGADSWAFAEEERDYFQELARSSQLFNRRIAALANHLNEIGYGAAAAEPLDCLRAIFTEKPEDSGLLALFLRYPVPRHPASGNSDSRTRYALLTSALLTGWPEVLILRAGVAVTYLDTTIIQRLRRL